MKELIVSGSKNSKSNPSSRVNIWKLQREKTENPEGGRGRNLKHRHDNHFHISLLGFLSVKLDARRQWNKI